MSEQIPKTSYDDEIDLGQLFGVLRRGLLNLFKGFLRLFVYLRSNIIILGILAIVGLALGFGLSKITSEKRKTEVIVRPNLQSRHYLIDAVEELNGKMESMDTVYFSSLGITADEINKFEIEVGDVVNYSEKEKEIDLKYLEMLGAFSESGLVNELLRSLLADYNTIDQRITFYYKNPVSGPVVAQKLLDHLNSNVYFRDLVTIYNQNATERIDQNKAIIKQIDTIIQSYTRGMNAGTQLQGQLVLSEEDEFNITDLFQLKNTLIAQTESKHVELQKRKSPLSIIHFGESQPVEKSLFGKYIFLAPFVFIVLYILKDIVRYLSRKSDELLA